MKTTLSADCRSAMDMIYGDNEDENGSLPEKIRLNIHIFFCPHCSQQMKLLESCGNILRSDFFPPSPSFEEKVMARISEEEDESFLNTVPEEPGGFSFRAWVLIGFFILVSLTSSYFGINFIRPPAIFGSSYLAPLGITIGIVLTLYGAFFIGSHLDELRTRFKIDE